MALSDLSKTFVGKTGDSKKATSNIPRGISSKTGEVDLTDLQNAKDNYPALSFNKATNWDQNVIPSYLKRIQYWDSFIKTERDHEKQRIDKVIKINTLKEEVDEPEKQLYLLLKKEKEKEKLLSAIDQAAENAVKESIPKNINKKGICDKLFEDLTSLIVTEARSNLNAVAGALTSAENTLISQVGTFVDGKLQPITQGIKDFYNGARNFLMDKLEAGLESILSTTRNAMGLDYATYNTVMSAAAQEAIAKVDLLNGYPIMQNPTPTKTPGKGVNASYYIVNPLEDRKLTPENITAIKEKLQEEANSIITHIYDVIGTSMFENGTNQDTKDYIVMSLMDAAKNRIHVFNYMTDILGYNNVTNKLMNSADNLRPSNIVKSLLYNNPWGEQNTAAQNVIGSVKKLMNFTDSEASTKFKKTLSDTVTSLMSKDSRSLPYDPNLRMVNKLAEAYINSKTESSSGYISVDVPGRNNSLNHLKNNDKNSEIEKLYREICGMFSINETNGREEANSLSPDPLWGDMRKVSKDGRGDVYGLNSLVKSFRVNKYIPSGEVDYFQNGFSHIFFVKPDLNLTQNAVAAMDMTGNPMLGDIITNLNYDNNELVNFWSDFPTVNSDYSRSNNYISYLLSNMMENIPITDLTLDTKDAYENLKGFKMPYGLTHYKNTWGGDISLTFKDTKTLLINNILQTWLKYISIMKEGIAECAPKYKNYGYLDYAGAIYGFITEPDGQTITHWFRYTGVFPVTVPFSTISTARSGQDIPEFSVNFKYAIYESNDVNILRDFNYIMNNGPLASQMGSADEMEKYASLGALPAVSAYTPLSDITLKTGVFPNENHAYVGIIFADEINNTGSEIHSMSQTARNSNSYRFILKYDSSQYFQSGLIGETPTNDTINTSTGFGAASNAANQAAVNQNYNVNFGL